MKKTKFKKKIFAALAAALLIFGSLSVGTLAAFDEDASSYGVNVESEADTVIADVKTNVDDDSAVKAEATEVNFFERLYDAVTDYISEILCVLAFGGSFLIAVLYKKGLLPLLKGALSAISSAVGKIKDATEESAISDAEKTAKITEALDRAHALIEAQTRSLEVVERRLDALSTDKTDRERMKLILECEVELLYDIFMSSALPEYQKDAVAKRLKSISSLIKEEKAGA